MRRVRGLLAEVQEAAETRRFVECVIVTLDKDGTIEIGQTSADVVKLVGMLETAKYEILNDQCLFDVE